MTIPRHHASNFFERCLSCANSHVHIHIMMDDVYIYHIHNFFRLCLFCVGTHEYLSTSQSHELTKRALESNDDLGSRGLSLPPFPSRKDCTQLLYLALTRLWAIYHFSHYAHFTVFTLHAMLASMPLPCNCDPCLHLPMILHYDMPSVFACLVEILVAFAMFIMCPILLMLVVLGES